MDFIKNIVILEPMIEQHFAKLKSKINDIQLNVDSEELIQYEYKILKEKKRVPGVIGGHHKNFNVLKKYFIKKMVHVQGLNEIYNYFLIQKQFPKLKSYTNKCYGVVFVPKDFEFNDDKMDKIINSEISEFKDVKYYSIKRYFILFF